MDDTYSAPKSPEDRDKWSQLLGCTITTQSYICEEHFQQNYVKSAEILHDVAGNVIYSYEFKKKVLLKGALPSKHSDIKINEELGGSANESMKCYPLDNTKLESHEENIPNIKVEPQQTSDNTYAEMFYKNEGMHNESKLCDEIKEEIIDNTFDEIPCLENTLYNKIAQQQINIKFPKPEWGLHYCPSRGLLIFSLIELIPDPENKDELLSIYTKQVVLNCQSEIQLRILGKKIDMQFVKNKPKSIHELENLIMEVDTLKTCLGGPIIKYYRNVHPECAYKDQVTWRHNKCSIILQAGSVCRHCLLLHTILPRHVNKKRIKAAVTPSTQNKIKNLSNKICII
ncbi:uncharacterized protein LOC144473768 isoform X2 [Augochlora pura]